MYYIGERFGRLTVISHHHKQNTRHFVVCRCVCGRLKIVSTSDLKSHRTFSCGCLSRELREERKKNKIKNEHLRYIWLACGNVVIIQTIKRIKIMVRAEFVCVLNGIQRNHSERLKHGHLKTDISGDYLWIE